MKRSLWVAVLLVAMAAWPLRSFGGGVEKEPDTGIGKAEDPNIPESKDTGGDEGGGDEGGGDEGTDNPDKANAVTVGDLEGTTHKKAPRATKSSYPMAVIERPLTLTATQAQVTLDVPMIAGTGAGGLIMTQVLRGSYGITQDIQVGVGYGFGVDVLGAKMGVKGYTAGKAFSVDGAYTVIPGWLAATISFPFYAQPFASSMTIGAPFRVTLNKQIALIGGQDLLQIRFAKFPVSLDRPWDNIAGAAVDAVHGTQPSGNLNLTAGALYQRKENLAFTGMIGFFLPDFGSPSKSTSLLFSGIWSKSKTLDFSFRFGFSDLAHPGDSVTFGLFAAYRL